MAFAVTIATTPADRQACYALRRAVFVAEQGVPLELEIESDEQEDHCTHLLVRDDDRDDDRGRGAVVATARLKVLDGGEAKAQRVAVVASARGKGAGAAVMHALHDEAWRRGCTRVVLSAQVTAIPFYERLGYVAVGPVYDDAGLPHRDMSLHRRV